MKTAELRGKKADELEGMILSLKQEQFNLRFQRATGTLENPSRFRQIRRTIARIQTLLNEQPGTDVKKAPAKKAKKG